ncbi:MAG: hypothetical protein R3A79_21480 [Nannocystaceae bacterium]
MNFERFTDEHWRMFVAFVSRFYPVPPALLADYADEWDWVCLSYNEALTWDEALIGRFEGRWRWVALSSNPAIVWDEPRLDRFAHRVDWWTLGFNTSLPVSEAFLAKYEGKFEGLSDAIVALTPELSRKASVTVFECPPSSPEENAEEPVTFANFEERLHALSYLPHTLPRSLYANMIEPFLDDERLAALFSARFDGRQRFYELTPHQSDAHGLTPEFQFERIGLYGAGITREMLAGSPSMVNGSLQEGPSRLHHIPRLSAHLLGHAGLLVSEPVKETLERFSLPPQLVFFPVTLKPKQVRTATPFYLMYLRDDQMLEDLRYDDVSFHYCLGDPAMGYRFGRVSPLDSSPTRAEEVTAAHRSLNQKESGPGVWVSRVFPDRFALSTTYDVTTYQGNWIVNAFVKEALARVCGGEVDFKSAQALRVEIDAEAYEAKRVEYSAWAFEPATLTVARSAKARAALEKMQRLRALDPPMKRRRGAERDEFTDAEEALNVRFPERFKAYHRKHAGKGPRGFRVLDPGAFFRVTDDYVTRHSEAYKGVVVAENGLGDGLALLLQKDSDHDLDTTFYECNHESGELRRKRSVPK